MTAMIARNQRPVRRVQPGMKVVRRGARLVTLAVVAVTALAGCGSEAGVGGAGSGGAGTTSPPGLTTSTPRPSTFTEHDPSDPPNPGISAGRTVTVVGVVTQGAEPSCLILQSSQGQFELISPNPVPHEGDQVTVVGHVVKAMSHCMQGMPFLVEQLTIN